MKIPEKIIDKLCKKILQRLKDKHLIVLKSNEGKILQRMNQSFLEDLDKENLLNQEVKKMLEKYRDAINRGEIDEHKMFQMIKKQLIKERNIVL